MINNIYLRLFVAQTKLMTAEKMQLDRFCWHGEYLAYKIALPTEPDLGPDNVAFVFDVDLAVEQYRFTNDNINEEEFKAFEEHLSLFLNELFRRKQDFEQNNEMFIKTLDKIRTELSIEEQRCLATNIDANTDAVLRALGVVAK